MVRPGGRTDAKQAREERQMPLVWLKSRFGAFKAQVLSELAEELEEEVSEDLIEALAAAAAMVAFADGVSSAEEREQLLAVFEEEDRLTEVDLDDLFDAFDDYAERFAEDPAAAESEALTSVAVFDDNPELGRLIVRGALVVASSDGALSPTEEQAVGRLCDALGLEVDELRKPVARDRRDEPNGDEDEEEPEE
jgi:tellurite resistance protein TerB